MRAVVFVFVDLSWRSELCAKKSRREIAIEEKMTGGRRRWERGAGGRTRCVGWPRCEHCDCAALKNARAGSRQKVPRRALRKETRSDLFSWFLNENEFELRNELTWHVDFEVDQLVGPVVALVEQNAIELDLRNVCRCTGYKVTFRVVGWRVRQRDCE